MTRALVKEVNPALAVTQDPAVRVVLGVTLAPANLVAMEAIPAQGLAAVTPARGQEVLLEETPAAAASLVAMEATLAAAASPVDMEATLAPA